MENPIPYLQIFIVVQAGLFLFYLAGAGRLTFVPNRVLAVLVTLLAVHMGVNLATQEFHIAWVPHLGIGLGFCYGPILFFYTRTLTTHSFSFEFQHLLHLLPAGVGQLLDSYTDISIFAFATGIFVSLGSYIVLTWRHLKQYRFVLSQTRSDYDQIALKWLSNLLILQPVLLALNILSVVLYILGYNTAGVIAETVLFCGLWMLVSLMIFQGLQHPLIFSGLMSDEQTIAEASTTNSSLPECQLQQEMDKIESHMKNVRPWLNPGLTVKSLGRQLSTVPKTVSQAINGIDGRNFSEYVNSYRIDHACELLQSQSDDVSIMDVMYESGFITKSNFNRAFKAKTGMTPLQFKNKNQNNS